MKCIYIYIYIYIYMLKKMIKKGKKRSGNWLGYYPTRSRYNELYSDKVVLGVQLAEEYVTIQSLYRDRNEGLA